MTIKELRKIESYSFQCYLHNIKKVKKDIKETDVYDEWGVAELFINDKQGVEYNLCIDQSCTANWIKEMYGEWKIKDMIERGIEIDEKPTNSSAIYLVERDEENECFETDYSCCKHYEIDFNNKNWKKELENAMCIALIEFLKL